MSSFKKATKEQAKLRAAIQGPSGSGKTRSALEIARNLGKKVAVIDSEQGSASKYAGVNGLDFDVCSVTDDYHPEKLSKLLVEAGPHYDVIIVDSMTHWWNGVGGFLELVDAEVQKMKARGGKPDSFAAWKVVDPVYRRLVQTILASPAHVIVTMRAKQSYEKEQDERGKTTVKKVGLAPEMRDNFQYEMDLEGMLDMEHNFIVGKTRCESIDGKVFKKPGKELADHLLAWLTDGAPVSPKATEPTWEDKAAEAKKLITDAALVSADELKAVAPKLATLLPKGKAPDDVRNEVSKFFAEANKVFA